MARAGRRGAPPRAEVTVREAHDVTGEAFAAVLEACCPDVAKLSPAALLDEFRSQMQNVLWIERAPADLQDARAPPDGAVSARLGDETLL